MPLLKTEEDVFRSPSQQETNVQNRAAPTSRSSVRFPPLLPTLNLITDGSRMEDIVAIGGHTHESIDQYYSNHDINSNIPPASQAPRRN